MPSGMPPFRDPAITRGMNTYDDPKVLKPGECIRLLNGFPGNPPRPRNGCTGLLMTGTADYRFIPPGVSFEYGGNIYAVVWVYDSVNSVFKPLAIDISDGSFTDLGDVSFTPGEVIYFDFLKLHGCVYASISALISLWGGSAHGKYHKVLESNAVIRDMCISSTASVNSVTAAGTGGSIQTGYYQYGFQYVRRNDSPAFESGGPITGMILPPNITADYKPKRIDTFLPGVCIGPEDSSKRKVQQAATDTTTMTIDIDILNDHEEAIYQGATHLRVCRTLTQTTQELAESATMFFLCDLPLLGAGGTSSFTDTLSSVTLEGEVNQLVTGYTYAPEASFIESTKKRVFLLNKYGRGYYSEVVGGDGFIDLETAQAYPQAWSSLFKPITYTFECDINDGQLATGMKLLGSDLFMWKERKLFAIYGGDPTVTSVTPISDQTGCAFPYTITKCEIRGFLGKCILFLGNEGPMVLQEGGKLRPFSEFKVKEIWPEKSLELYSELDTDYDWIIHNCSAAFFKNTWWILYRTKAGTSRIFGYYFDPALGAGEDAPRGAFEFEFASM